MREAFISCKEFQGESMEAIERCAQILEKYSQQGYTLTLRQVYYQMVSHDWFPDSRRWVQVNKKWVRDPNGTKNAEPNYKWLGDLISKARLAGLLDWDYIEDRVRETVTPTHWESPAEIVRVAARQFAIDKWSNQPRRVEVMAEKDAVSGILEPVCKELDIPFTANRGYSSQSFMYRRGKAIKEMLRGGQDVHVLYFGDHDPSGLDMDRDVEARLRQFAGISGDDGRLEVVRLALTWSQIEEYEPPPNPAKLSDSRAEAYIAQHGDESWELDALEPRLLASLVREHVEQLRDDDLWEEALDSEREMREQLDKAIEAMEE
jgi:hypothetical protein